MKPEYYIALFAPRVGKRSKRPITYFLCGGTFKSCEKRLGEYGYAGLYQCYGAIVRDSPPPVVEHLFS